MKDTKKTRDEGKGSGGRGFDPRAAIKATLAALAKAQARKPRKSAATAA